MFAAVNLSFNKLAYNLSRHSVNHTVAIIATVEINCEIFFPTVLAIPIFPED